MKRLIIFLTAVMSVSISYGQLSMKIDSIDISLGGKVFFAENRVVSSPDAPRIRIVAIIENNTNDRIVIFVPNYWNETIFSFCYKGQRFEKYAPWTSPIDEYNQVDFSYEYFKEIIRPFTSKIFIFTTFLPENREKLLDVSEINKTHPDWSWGKDNPTDMDYLRWFKEVLPSIRVRISYNGRYTLKSIPIDLKKVVVTSNMTKEQLN